MANQLTVNPITNVVEITQENTSIVQVVTAGPQGPVGPIGPQGPSGSVDFTSGSSTYLYVSSSGQVGIGTQTPTSKLVISGSSTEGLFSIITTSSPSILFVSGNGNIGIGTTTPTNTLQVNGGITATSLTGSINASNVVGLNLSRISTGSITASVNIGVDTFRVQSGSSTYLYVSSSGNIGIGTTTPTNTLQVNGGITSTSLTASGATINGNIVITGTASINSLIVNQTQLSTGSNQLGDAINDTQTLYGSVIIPTGSLTLTGSAILTGALTASNISASNNISASTLHIANISTFNSRLNANGAITTTTITSSGAISSSAGLFSTTLTATNNSTIGGTLGVTGATTLTGPLTASNISASSTISDIYTGQGLIGGWSITSQSIKNNFINISHNSTSSIKSSWVNYNFRSNISGALEEQAVLCLINRYNNLTPEDSSSAQNGAFVSLGFRSTMFTPGVFLSGSGEFNLQSSTNQYIRSTGSNLDIQANNININNTLGIGTTIPTNSLVHINGILTPTTQNYLRVTSGSTTIFAVSQSGDRGIIVLRGVNGNLNLSVVSGSTALQLGSETGDNTRIFTDSITTGANSSAPAPYASAFGSGSLATGTASFAEGMGTLASGFAAHAMGINTTASGLASLTAGTNTDAVGQGSVAFGNLTSAGGDNSFAAGQGSNAAGTYSTAMGLYTTADADGQVTLGQYNELKSDKKNVLVIGAGTNEANRHNIIEVIGGNQNDEQQAERQILFDVTIAEGALKDSSFFSVSGSSKFTNSAGNAIEVNGSSTFSGGTTTVGTLSATTIGTTAFTASGGIFTGNVFLSGVNNGLLVDGTTTTANLSVTNTASIGYLQVAGTASIGQLIYVQNAITTGSNTLGDDSSDIQTLIGNTIISGSITQSLGNNAIFGNNITVPGTVFGTSSWAQSASNALRAISASRADTASFLPVNTYQITSSWAQSASNAINAQTASFLSGAFLQNGNSFGTTAILGTNDAQNLQFETSGSVRMTISSSGNVGIGTIPSEWIHLNSAPSSGKYIQIDADQSGGGPTFVNNTPNFIVGLQAGGAYPDYALGYPDYWMEIKLSGNVVLIPCYTPATP